MNGEQKEALFAALRPDDATVHALKAKALQPAPRRKLLPAAVAAMLVLIGALGVWFTVRNHQTPPQTEPSDPIVTTTQPSETIPTNPDGSVNYTALTSDGQPIPTPVGGPQELDLMEFSDAFLQGCDLLFEGTALEVWEKQYDFRYYYGEKFGEEVVIHETPTTLLTTFRIDKVWRGDRSLVGTTITLEDQRFGMQGIFGYREGITYVVPVQDLGDWKMWQPDDEEQYLVEGDVERNSPYASYYAWQPPAEVAKTGDFIVPSTWNTVTAGCTTRVLPGKDAADAEWFKYGEHCLLLVEADVFAARMAALVE